VTTTTGGLPLARFTSGSHQCINRADPDHIMHNGLWAYLGLNCVTIGSLIYQTYRYSYSRSISLTLLTVFDAVIVYPTVVEYRKRDSLDQSWGNCGHNSSGGDS
jgi:uncharacterized membrane protein